MTNKQQADDCTCGKVRKCKICQRKYNQDWYKKNRAAQHARVKANSAAYHAEEKEFLRAEKSKPCTDCKRSFHWFAMDFDHLSNKDMDLSLAARHGWRIDRIKREAAKCEVVCAVCHRLRTFARAEAAGSWNKPL